MISKGKFGAYCQVVSLFFETILPYIKNKVLKQNNKILEKLVYLGEFLTFGYQFRYLVDDSFVYFKPYFQMFGIIVRGQN